MDEHRDAAPLATVRRGSAATSLGDEERIIDEVAESVDPLLRWYMWWVNEGMPVEVDGATCYLSVTSWSTTYWADRVIQVSGQPTVGRLSHLSNVSTHVAITVHPVTRVKIVAPPHVRDALATLLKP